MNSLPMLIAVAPNGARRTKKDHSELPLTPGELARSASACAQAGAAMVHLHVRNSKGEHTLDPARYLPAVREVEAAVGDTMLIQVTSESAGIYEAGRQADLMEQLAPHCLSCGLREFVQDITWAARAEGFFSRLYRAGTLIQYILYSPEDVDWYEQLCREGVLPGETHFLLFVLGRHGDGSGGSPDLIDYIQSLRRKSRWMVCAFGTNEYNVVRQAAELGGHARVGFENNLLLPDGSLAANNEALVKIGVETAENAGRTAGDRKFAGSLF
jgi:uncharacterized protein (DUF849 family)